MLILPLDESGGGRAVGAAGRLPFPPLLWNSLPRRRHLESSALGLAPPYCGRSQSAPEAPDLFPVGGAGTVGGSWSPSILSCCASGALAHPQG